MTSPPFALTALSPTLPSLPAPDRMTHTARSPKSVRQRVQEEVNRQMRTEASGALRKMQHALVDREIGMRRDDIQAVRAGSACHRRLARPSSPCPAPADRPTCSCGWDRGAGRAQTPCPVSAGIDASSFLTASRPPAEAPSPTTRNLSLLGRNRLLQCRVGAPPRTRTRSRHDRPGYWRGRCRMALRSCPACLICL